MQHSMEAARAVTPFSFRPSDTQVIEWYLRPEIAGNELHDYAGSFFIKGVDVYSAAPYDLVADHAPAPGTGDGGGHWVWYFFNDFSASRRTRRSRTVAGGKGSWHTEAGRKQVEGSAGGYMSKFSYKEKTSSGTMMPGGWLMVEYGIHGCDIVIAKIYKSPRRSATNVPPFYTASSSVVFTMMQQEVESFLMTDAGGALDPVESSQSHPYFTNNDNTSQAMGTRCSPTTTPLPPPLLAQGTEQYAAAAPGQGAGHPLMVMDLDDIGNDADWALWNNQQEVLGHEDHSLLPSHHMVPSAAANATVLGAAYAQPQHLAPEPAIVGMLAGDLVPNPLELVEY